MATTQLVSPKRLTRRAVKAWRKARKMSAAELAKHLGYSRSYIKSVEGGSLAVTEKFTERFCTLQAEWDQEEPHPDPPRSSLVTSPYKLPSEVRLQARPRRCRVCREWFIFPWANQRTCKRCKRGKHSRKTKR